MKTATRFRSPVIASPNISSQVNMSPEDSLVVNTEPVKQIKLDNPVKKKPKAFLEPKLTKAIERIITHVR
ncbi:hypothetical protein JXM67_06095 [candidate division WOR-3 bacterium]|nr:hypothetical protein [candidate division WOR-3 bacterium]